MKDNYSQMNVMFNDREFPTMYGDYSVSFFDGEGDSYIFSIDSKKISTSAACHSVKQSNINECVAI